MDKQLYVTFEWPPAGEGGVPVDSLTSALQGIQTAMRIMVEHLGGRRTRIGRPPRWASEQGKLRLVTTKPGSFVALLDLEPQASERSYLNRYGERALDALIEWDGSEDSTLPKVVIDSLYSIPSNIPDDMRIWLGNEQNTRKVELRYAESAIEKRATTEEALLYGWLNEVDWGNRTARLYQYGDQYVRLRFDSTLNGQMRSLATRHIQVRGYGRINSKNKWTSVEVREISETASWDRPFDLEVFRNDPNPKIFDSKNIVRASEPFDAHDFIRRIHEDRDADLGRETLSNW